MEFKVGDLVRWKRHRYMTRLVGHTVGVVVDVDPPNGATQVMWLNSGGLFTRQDSQLRWEWDKDLAKASL